MKIAAFALLALLGAIINPYRFAPTGGPDVWYWAGGLGDSSYTSSTNAGWAPQLHAYGADITVGQAGTCTFIAFKGDVSITTRTAKLALYNASNALIANGSVSVTATGMNWRQVAVNVPVSAGTYKVMISFEENNGIIGYDTSGPDGTFDDNVSYASFPPDPLVPGTETDILYGVKMYVD